MAELARVLQNVQMKRGWVEVTGCAFGRLVCVCTGKMGNMLLTWITTYFCLLTCANCTCIREIDRGLHGDKLQM